MKSITNIVAFSFLLILPIAYYPDSKDSTHFTIGGGIGFGNYATLIEGCEGGQSVHMVSFRDFGASVAVHPTVHSPFVLGFQGGYFSVEDPPEPISTEGVFDYPQSNHPYINPSLSLEFRPIGIGAGWLRNFGTVYPPSRWNIQRYDFRRSRDFPSGHIRLGRTDSWFTIASFCEGFPVMTQYGTILGGIGHGSPGGKTFMGGICGGLHQHAGLYLGITSKSGRVGAKSYSIRIGRNLDTFEGSIAFAWYFPIK